MEEIALAIQMDAERLGAVAFHHARPRDAYVVLPNNLLHRYWLHGWDAASHGKQCFGAVTALVDGLQAFMDGVSLEKFPHLHITAEYAEWLNSWARARAAHQGVNRRCAPLASLGPVGLKPKSDPPAKPGCMPS